MKLKYQAALLPQQSGASKVTAVSCSPNGGKIAVAGSDRNVVLFDERGEMKDKFSTKPIDKKFGKKSYSVRTLSFSPDSSKLAVGQSDNVVYVYKIGTSWNEKKVIVNKLLQTSCVSSLDWAFEDKLLIGLADGKVRIGLIKSNKCSSLYKTDQPVTAIATNPKKTAFVSGHLDGSIILFIFSSKTQSKICTHNVPPYSMVFTTRGLMVAGSDRRVFSYTENGVVQQQFDFLDQNEKEFSAICRDPTGQNVVVGSFDRLRVFSWNTRRGAWEDAAPLQIPNVYAITALAWKGDGAAVYCGTLCGSVLNIDCSLKRAMLRSRFETTYVAPSHVIVRDISTETRTSVISQKGLHIDDLKMMGNDRFVVAYTSSTLIVADTQTGKSSELEWMSGGHEKFFFDYANVCLIVNAGEVTVVQYGHDGALGWVRTEHTSAHLLSLQVDDDDTTREKPCKKIAYLVDRTTIAIHNLITSQQETLLDHTTSIDWLELSDGGDRILFRDKRSRVTLYDIASERRTNLLNFCTYVQWVPGSDVIVAQSGDNLHVWYNPEHPEQATVVSVKGEVESVIRDQERTEVIVQETNAKVAYELDHAQIEFASALENLNFERAVTFLERNGNEQETYTMWRRVADLAIEQGKLFIAQRCYAAIKDIPRVNMLQETIQLANEAAKTIGGDGTAYYKVRANIARIKKKFKEAEKIYLEQNGVEDAIQMYQSLHKWDEALELAKAKNYPGYEMLKASYYRSLFDTGQDAKAAELKLTEGDPSSAVQLFLKSNQPVQALNVVLTDTTLLNDHSLTQTIVAALIKNRLFEKAGELYEKTKDFDKALDYYLQGNGYAEAIQLSRFAFPEKVVVIEEKWGDYLMSSGQPDAAINHFLEANASVKAVEAAISAKEWSKAVQIVDVIHDNELSKKFYGQIAEYYASVGEFDRAERLYIEADLQKPAIHMYIRNNKWADAYRLSEEFLGKEETAQMYDSKAEELEGQGRLAEAEQLYISIGMSNKAIQMYRKANRNEDVVRLVERYHSEHLLETHKRLGLDLEEAGNFKDAEEEYLKAGEYKMAIEMFTKNDMWSEAYRIAKTEGGDVVQKQVGYLWAKSLGGDAAVKLLNKFSMLSDAIDTAIENGAFDFAFELSNLGMKERLSEVHTKIAMQMEEEGRLEEAADHYVKGGKADEAVAMFIHDQDWNNAEKIAKEHAPNALSDVYIGESRKALEQGDHTRAESFLLRANRPDIILRYFKENGMWPDAVRIAKEYLPNQLAQVQEEFDQNELRSGARGIDSYILQGKEWETQGDYVRAAQAYLRISPDIATPEQATMYAHKAADIAMRFLNGNEHDLIGEILARLQELDSHEKAAELLLSLGSTRQAIEAFCQAKQWNKAKQVASEFMPEMLKEIENVYKESLRSEGRLGELIDVDVIAAIDLLVERGQWEKALETAKQQKHGPLLDKYVVMYASELLSQKDYRRATKLFEHYGASGNPENFNIYKAIFDEAVSSHFDDGHEEYEKLSSVRNMYQLIVDSLEHEDSDNTESFRRQLLSLHLLCFRDALLSADEVESRLLRLKQSISLLRYSDLIPADRVFYEAGKAAREYGGAYEGLAFIFLNHYLDLSEAIEDASPDGVDFTKFEETDIPKEVPLPEKQYLQGTEHEDIKEWVLAVSVDDSASNQLLLDSRGGFEGSLVDSSGNISEQCILSGYPILGAKAEIGPGVWADKEELNKFMILLKTTPTDQLQDVSKFLSKYAKNSFGLII